MGRLNMAMSLGFTAGSSIGGLITQYLGQPATVIGAVQCGVIYVLTTFVSIPGIPPPPPATASGAGAGAVTADRSALPKPLSGRSKSPRRRGGSPSPSPSAGAETGASGSGDAAEKVGLRSLLGADGKRARSFRMKNDDICQDRLGTIAQKRERNVRWVGVCPYCSQQGRPRTPALQGLHLTCVLCAHGHF